MAGEENITISKKNERSDVRMHSESLKFIFDNDFGFDTLTVNGRFESTRKGFSKMVKSFSLGSLNALGIGLKFNLIKRFDLIMLLLSRLSEVEEKIAE